MDEKKDRLFEGLEQSSFDAKKMRGCDYEQVDKAFFKWFSLQRSQNVPIDGPILLEKALQFAKVLIFRPLKLHMESWISGKKGKETTFTVK